MYFLCFFWFTVCTSIIFFFSSLGIYILSLFFLFTACTSIISFFYKNLCTFFFVFVYSVHFRIRINVLIVLESIFICFVEYFYHKRTWQTKLFRSKKYWINKNMRTFFYISLLYFGNTIATNQMRWEVKVIGWLNLCFFFFFCLLSLLFLFTVCS